MPCGLVPKDRISRELWVAANQSYVVGHPGSIGIAKLRFQDHPNLLQIVAARFVGEAEAASVVSGGDECPRSRGPWCPSIENRYGWGQPHSWRCIRWPAPRATYSLAPADMTARVQTQYGHRNYCGHAGGDETRKAA